MPAMRSAPPASASGGQHSRLPRAPTSRIAAGGLAAGSALAGVRHGEGVRIGLLGDSGTGKTRAAQALLAAYLDQSPGYALVIDAKAEGRFGGQQYATVGELAERPPMPEPRVLSFSGDPFSGFDVDAEEVSALAWRLAARRARTLQVHDELEHAAIAGQWRRGTRWIPRSFTQGRSHGISVLWGTQSPQGVPREAFEQSDAILCFRLAGIGLRCLRERGYCEGGADSIIPTLPGADSPPRERGVFVLLLRGRPWDRRLYKFD